MQRRGGGGGAGDRCGSGGGARDYDGRASVQRRRLPPRVREPARTRDARHARAVASRGCVASRGGRRDGRTGGTQHAMRNTGLRLHAKIAKIGEMRHKQTFQCGGDVRNSASSRATPANSAPSAGRQTATAALAGVLEMVSVGARGRSGKGAGRLANNALLQAAHAPVGGAAAGTVGTATESSKRPNGFCS